MKGEDRESYKTTEKVNYTHRKTEQDREEKEKNRGLRRTWKEWKRGKNREKPEETKNWDKV